MAALSLVNYSDDSSDTDAEESSDNDMKQESKPLSIKRSIEEINNAAESSAKRMKESNSTVG